MRRIQVFIASAVKASGDSSDAARNHSERTKQKNLISLFSRGHALSSFGLSFYVTEKKKNSKVIPVNSFGFFCYQKLP